MPGPLAESSRKLAVRRALLAGGIGLATSSAAIALQLLSTPPVVRSRSTLPVSSSVLSSVADRLVVKPAATPLLPGPAHSGMPQLLPVEGWLSDGFRWRQDPFDGLRRFHGGLDIVAPAGAIVRAPADGLVTYAASTAGYGNLIEIRHGGQYGTRFAHLAAFLTEAGRIVHLGQPIGLVGTSGRTNGAHLHYEVLKDGRRVNPWPYLGDLKSDPQRTTFSVTHATVRAER